MLGGGQRLHVVLHGDGEAGELLRPFAQGQVVPAQERRVPHQTGGAVDVAGDGQPEPAGAGPVAAGSVERAGTVEQFVDEFAQLGEDVVDVGRRQPPVGRGADLGAKVADHADQLVTGDLHAHEELTVGPDRQRAGRTPGARPGPLGRGQLLQVAHLDERTRRLGDGRGGQAEPAGEGDTAQRALGQHGGEHRRDCGRDGVSLRKHDRNLGSIISFVKY